METTETELMQRMMVSPEKEAEPEAVVEEEQAAIGEAEVETPEPDQDAEQEVNQAPPKYTVKVDGKEIEVTLEDLTRSYSGQSYIQKGMQEAAAARKAAEELSRNLQAQQAEFVAVVQQVQQHGFKAPPQAPDIALAQTDPIGYIQAEASYRKELAEYQGQRDQIKSVMAQHEAAQQRALAEYVASQAQILREAIPELSDAKAAGEFKEKLRKTGVEYGFSDAELDGIVDARHVQVLRDAMRWRELQAGKALAPKPKDAPRTVVPQARRPEPEQLARSRQLEKAKKSGSDDDFVNLMLVKR